MPYLRSLLKALVAALVYLFTLGWLRQLFELVRDLLRTFRRGKALWYPAALSWLGHTFASRVAVPSSGAERDS